MLAERDRGARFAQDLRHLDMMIFDRPVHRGFAPIVLCVTVGSQFKQILHDFGVTVFGGERQRGETKSIPSINAGALLHAPFDFFLHALEKTLLARQHQRRVRTPVIASGVVKTLDDISTLFYLPNIAGVITSRALFGGAFTFREANAIATAQHEPTAPFL
jgi:hypothetical protein